MSDKDLRYKVVDCDGIVWATFRWKVDAEKYVKAETKIYPFFKDKISIVEETE